MENNLSKNQHKERLGETRMMKCGMKATIIEYRTAVDIDVQFEDGTINRHKAYNSFTKGEIGNKNCAENHIGETRIMSNGMNATIISYRNLKDIDVQFEDGTTIYHKRYTNFKIGNIGYPRVQDNVKKHTRNRRDKKCEKVKQYPIACKTSKAFLRIGETREMKNGLKATIETYLNANDISVRFEDGILVEHKRYRDFTDGEVKHPDYNANKIRSENKKEIGNSMMMSCGLNATIIKYKIYDDIEIQFEDGTRVSHRQYATFKTGQIAHPTLSSRGKGVFNNFITRFAFRENDKVYYNCKCQGCGYEDILTPQQMMQHVCK